MSKVLVTESYLEDIADAIRTKAGASTTYTPADMAGAIENLPTGGSSDEYADLLLGFFRDPSAFTHKATLDFRQYRKILTDLGETYAGTPLPYQMCYENPNVGAVILPSSCYCRNNLSSQFNGCSNLTSLTFVDDGTYTLGLSNSMFRECNLSSVVIPDWLTSISSYVFMGNRNLETVVWNSDLPIPDGTFQVSHITNLTINGSPTSIGMDAFSSSAVFERHYVIPASVTSIGTRAFAVSGSSSSATDESSFTFLATTPPTLGSNAFYGIPHIYVPAASVDAYKAATNWSTYARRIEAIQG